MSQLRFPKQNLYKVLGLQNFATFEEIRQRYRKLAMLYHPDRGGKTKDMQMLNNIYDIFKEYKKEYDEFLQYLLNPMPRIVVEFSFGIDTDNSTTSSTGGWYGFYGSDNGV